METDDDAMLDTAGRALTLYGPSAFTLARAGEEAGIAAATLVKRFGSKRALFVRLSQRWVGTLEGALAATEAGAGSALERLRAVALHSYHDFDRPDTAARQLAALAVDLQDDELRELLHRGWGIVRAHLARHVADAVAAGGLAGHPVTAVGVTPGWLRSEQMLEGFGVTEATWRGACAAQPGFAISESPAYVARGVAALAADGDAGRYAGRVLSSYELADAYGVTDTDGSRPDAWGLIETHGMSNAGPEVIAAYRH